MYAISVILPVYNSEEYLGECLDSVFSQTGVPFEVLLVDDGSTDGSAKICDRAAAEYPNCRVFHQTNSGVAASRNFGMEQAKGAYVCFVDSDDTLLPGALSFLYEKAEATGADVVMGGFTLVTPDGAEREVVEPDCVMTPENLPQYFPVLKDRNLLDTPVDKLYRVSFLRRWNLTMPVGETYEDTAFNLSVLENFSKIASYGRSFYYYRQHKGSLTKRYDAMKLPILKKRWEQMCRVVTDNRDYADFFYLKSVLSCLMDLYLPDSGVSPKIRRQTLRREVKDPVFSRCAANAVAPGRKNAAVIRLCRTKSPFCIGLFCCGFCILKYRLPGLFLKVKT